MANERISMRKIRDIIRLRDKGLGYRQIGRALRISHPVVSQYARDFAATGLSYAQIKGISDSELMELLAGGRTADARYAALGAWFERCARELKRVGVTIHQIWEEVPSRAAGRVQLLAVSVPRSERQHTGATECGVGKSRAPRGIADRLAAQQSSCGGQSGLGCMTESPYFCYGAWLKDCLVPTFAGATRAMQPAYR